MNYISQRSRTTSKKGTGFCCLHSRTVLEKVLFCRTLYHILGATISYIGANVSCIGANVSYFRANVSYFGATASYFGVTVSYFRNHGLVPGLLYYHWTLEFKVHQDHILGTNVLYFDNHYNIILGPLWLIHVSYSEGNWTNHFWRETEPFIFWTIVSCFLPSLLLGLDLLLLALLWPYSYIVFNSRDSLIVKDNSELRLELREDLKSEEKRINLWILILK